MYRTKVYVLIAASTVLAAGAAQAADLPSRKAAPVAYVKICDVYGRGFYYIPGTNTCLKVGGRVRFELAWFQSQNAYLHRSAGGNAFVAGRTNDTMGWRARAYINMDARTQTAWGTVQSVISVAIRSRSGVFNNSGGFGAGGQNTANPQVYAAYIRFAGFTVGRAAGNFYFMPSKTWFTGYWGQSSNGTLQLAYTATFGGGFSATLALEDHNDFRQSTRANRLAGVPGVINPTRMPVIVANLRLDQGWGTAFLAGTITPNSHVYTNGVTGIVSSVSKNGWAVAGGLMIKLPSLARGDRLYLHAAYADGAISHIMPPYLNGDRSDGRAMGGFMRNDENVTLFLCPTGGGVVCTEKTKGWSVGAVLTHFWTPTLHSNFAVSYVSLTPGAVSRRSDWYALGGLGKGNALATSANLVWTPTRGFEIGLELHYRKVRQSLAGIPGLTLPYGNPALTPASVGAKRNPHIFMTKIRVQRTF
jgi:hypothetical protein